MLIQLVCLLVFVSVSVSKLELGACTNSYTGQYPFDLNQFGGRWYLQTTLDNPKQKCITWDFVVTNTTKDKFIIRTREVESSLVFPDELKVKEGVGLWKYPESLLGELLVKFNGPFQPMKEYYVLDTDFSSYAMIYTCKTYLWYIKSFNVWILTRNQSETNFNAYNSLHPFNLDLYPLYYVRQNDC